MNDSPVDPLAELPPYLRDILNQLPEDHSIALSETAGPLISDIKKLTDRRKRYAYLLLSRHRLTRLLAECPSPCPDLILRRAEVYEALGYSELALADAYVSYTLCLVALDDPDISDLEPVDLEGNPWPPSDDGQSEDDPNPVALKQKYRSLVLMCRSAIILGVQTQAKLWIDEVLAVKRIIRRLNGEEPREPVRDIEEVVGDFSEYSTIYEDESKFHKCVKLLRRDVKPTLFGWCQRQIYPWNEYEPDRMSKEALIEINEKLHVVAPDLEVEISTLPTLTPSMDEGMQRLSVGELRTSVSSTANCSSQLGLFAKKQLAPGATILRERSVLTAIRPHGEAVCDACAADMEDIDRGDRRYCVGCNIPFCSEECQRAANERYHHPNEEDYETDEGYPPAEAPFCPGSSGNDDLHTLGRAESSTTPEWDLYFLLLSRTLQLAETQKLHPLDLFETKYLWGDFSPTPEVIDLPLKSGPKSLPYSVRHHVELPLQWFEVLMHSRERCRPYSATWLKKYDWWIIQTLFSKFRGVADAQQSTWTGKGVGEARFAVANHMCRKPTIESGEPACKRSSEGIAGVRDAHMKRNNTEPWHGDSALNKSTEPVTSEEQVDSSQELSAFRRRPMCFSTPPNTSLYLRLRIILDRGMLATEMPRNLPSISMEQHYGDHPQQKYHYRPRMPLASRIRSFATVLKPDKTTLPRLGQYSKAFFLDHWLDVVCVLAIAGITGAIWIIPTRPHHLFPLLTPDGATYNPLIGYPYVTPIFSSLLTGLLCGLVPLAVIFLSQTFARSFTDFSSATLGLLYSLVTGTCLQVILKKFIGGLRPHFLSVCIPVVPDRLIGSGYNGMMYRAGDVCTGNPKDIDNALQSFPSGHSEIAFAGMGYLSIYLFAHLHIGDASKPEKRGFWRMILVLMPILFATYISSTLVLGYHHFAHDCLFGAAIGCLTAVLGYRIAFRGLLDARMNWRPRLGRRLRRVVDAESDKEHHVGLERVSWTDGTAVDVESRRSTRHGRGTRGESHAGNEPEMDARN
ncbi:hypothetical protein FOPE_02996 [Fonsecaea pedrosoi]|nr:hypothetical protein FOPE_02996 [Fonsecaea pedrosoi]